ncbi:MAG: hypothetical protein CBC38_07890 [Gammaproteobacteria bacterium TMED78]|nr:MAG: hypothetical protein CBC38_07890 [Gammaproteobacteria bacterium TMED78]|tara:strand:- start:4674 stop:5441 length:768 start_codon:yes stop_codon:yes gene_type:complete
MTNNFFFQKILILIFFSAISACASKDNLNVHSSSQHLPNWSGWWSQVRGAANNGQQWLYNDDLYLTNAAKIVDGPAMSYCIPARFNGVGNGTMFTEVEFLLMPQRLTITNADNMLRRIPVNGQPLRENPEATNGGTSIGHWEGEALIIETIGLHPDTTFPVASRPNGWLIGEDVHVEERYKLNEQDQLVVEVKLTAPHMLRETINYTNIYERRSGHIYRDHDVCSLNDRSIDPQTGAERFDLSPPDDLPPPPIIN